MSTDDEEFSSTQWMTSGANGLDLVPFSCCKKATDDNYKDVKDPSCQRGNMEGLRGKVSAVVVVVD